MALLPTVVTCVPAGIVPATELVSFASRLPVTVAATVTARVVISDVVVTVVAGRTLAPVLVPSSTA